MLQTPTSYPAARQSIPADPPRRNTAAIASLVCAILFPVAFCTIPAWNIWTHFAPMPEWLGTLIALCLTVLPAATVVLAIAGLVRSFTRPLLRHTRWQAIAGLVLGVMWVGGAYFFLA